MNKNGFTLAEVLVTLGIIGVIAALTMPTITANTQAAKIGPKLGRAVTVFEQANKQMLADDDYASLFSYETNSDYINSLNNHIDGAVSGSSILTKDNVRYDIDYKSNSTITSRFHNNNNCGTVEININPSQGKSDGVNHFYFGLFADGSLRPKGGSLSWDGGADTTKWDSSSACPKDAVPANATYCAGHIFENNMKVLYK